jgi:hypothetical protein
MGAIIGNLPDIIRLAEMARKVVDWYKEGSP